MEKIDNETGTNRMDQLKEKLWIYLVNTVWYLFSSFF
jgi:hypothetical protein